MRRPIQLFANLLLAVVGLFLLVPLVGEYLLGNVSIVELPALPILALLYGSGAILVRELARRTGRGWPTMLGLGLAYGLLEAGPIDQTLFNPPGGRCRGHLPAGRRAERRQRAGLRGRPRRVEHRRPHRHRGGPGPWAADHAMAGPVGLSVTGALYLLGAVLIFRYMQRTEQFLAPVPWRLGAAVVAAGLVARWSRRAGWGDRHRLALAGGALLTYAWGGFLLSFLLGRTGPIHYLGDAALAAAAVALLTVTTRRLRREHDGQTRGPPAGSGSGAGSVDGGDENSRTR